MKFVFRVAVLNNKVEIVDPTDHRSRFEVDQVIFDETRRISPEVREGVIVSVHGMPQDIAKVLPQDLLRSLGVGAATSRALGRRPERQVRLRATSEGFSVYAV